MTNLYIMCKSLATKRIYISKQMFTAYLHLMKWDLYHFDYDRDTIIEILELPEELICYMFNHTEELYYLFFVENKKEVCI